MRIVFFGTPGFAVPSLRALLRERPRGRGVVTQPDQPQGRSRSTLVPPPVKLAGRECRAARPAARAPRWATSSSPVSAGSSPSSASSWPTDTSCGPRCSPLPRSGMINVHASLLPRLRGAAPIQRAILNGDRKPASASCRWRPASTADRCCTASRPRSASTTPPARSPSGWPISGPPHWWRRCRCSRPAPSRPEPQDHTLATFAPKIDRDTARIDWETRRGHLARQIRAFDPAPGAWTTLTARLKLFGARAVTTRR